MSWWSSKSPIEQQIETATSEDIPTNEQNLALNLEICDEIRSKRAPAKDAVRALRRRLYNRNPNVQVLALHLLDLCVKNGGSHFLEEVATKDFMDAYVAQITTLINQDRSDGVVALMLEYLQTWALIVKDRSDLAQINKAYQHLRSKPGIVFPEASAVSSSFADSATAPDWVDSDTCMKSGRPFTFYNRKHHCRNCGGVYMQEFCSNFLPLPHFGINEPVRVCDDCKTKLADKYRKSKPTERQTRGAIYHTSNNTDLTGSFDNDLRKALEQSLRDTDRRNEQSHGLPASEEMDEDLKAAIAASLADMERVQPPQSQGQFSSPVPRVDNSYSVQNDSDTVQALRSALENAQPKEVFLHPRFADLMNNAEACQPKVTNELTNVANKLQTLEDLHGRLSAISGYYDRMLDVQLRHAIPGVAPTGQPIFQAPLQAQATPGSQASQITQAPQAQTAVAKAATPGPAARTQLRPSAPAYNATFATYSAPPAPHGTLQSQALSSAPPATIIAPAASTEAALSQIPSAPTEVPTGDLEKEDVETTELEPKAEEEPEPEPVLIEL